MLKLDTTTTTTNNGCATCGTIKRNGKPSCCVRGGSWFGKCGSAGDVNFEYTWYEGISACTTPSQAVMGQQLHSFQAETSGSSDDTKMIIGSKVAIAAAHMLTSTSANTSAQMAFTTPVAVPENMSFIAAARKSMAGESMAKPSHASASAQTIAQKCNSLLHVVTTIGMILTSVFWY